MLREDPRAVVRRVNKAMEGVKPMGEAEIKRCCEVAGEIIGRVPCYWRRVHGYGAGAKWEHTIAKMSAIVTVAYMLDGKCWIHASIARPDRLASYEDLCKLKEEFLGPEARAIQVFPPKTDHVNIHTNCLHLFSCLDGDGLPDFTMGSKSL